MTAEYGPKPRGAESKGAPAGDKKGDEKDKGAKAEAAKEEGSFDVRLPDASEGNVSAFRAVLWGGCTVEVVCWSEGIVGFDRNWSRTSVSER